MKSIFTINAAIAENMECLIVKVHALTINLQVGVSLGHGASLLFISLQALRTLDAKFQARNNISNAPASTALSQDVLH